ncbi:unnamed protein product [Mytilus edulis]|uniref:Uncharacterized protein n=1 Tax=Mytilus edulis TaxID=6550 RepID=A0A8S3QDH6_MYTED|nr:unnamed protein product [Mytilus edulis]
MYYKTPLSQLPVEGRLTHFLKKWISITSDCWVLSVIRGGLTLQFKEQPPLSPVPIPLSNTQDPQKFLLLSTEVETLLTKRAVEEVPVSSIDPGFYSRLFLVSKKTGGMRPVIDLSILNSYMIIPHFKMETNRSIRASILPGEHYLTRQCIVRPPQEKFQNLCLKIHLFLSKKTVTARQFSQLLGLLNSLADVVPLGRLHIRPLQFYLHQHWLPATQDWEFPVPIIHQELFPHLVWWTSQANVLRGQLLSSPVPNQTLFTDASNLGWGAYLEGLSVSGVWTPDLLKEHINILEMKAVLLALSHFQSLLQNKSLIVVRHVPGKLNVLADALSRTLTPVNTEWELLQSVFQAITLQWGSPHVDLFATSLNYKVQVFMSPVPDPKAYAVDCMSVPWDGMFAYAFPPFRFLSEDLSRASSWCSEKEIDPFQISVQQLADFLIHLFEEKGLSPSTIKGYRSAISRTIQLSGGPDFGNNEFISLLVKNFTLERPRQRVLIPSWNLSLVLSALKTHPFEPAEKVEIKFLSYKCCFLLALASGRRRSEIHAFSTADYCLRFNRDKSSVTLLTDPAFLAKNQIPGRGSEPIVIPALPVLCPIRVLLLYLQRTRSLRTSSNSRLFIPINKGKQDLSAKTISTWICKTIQLAYSFSNEELLNSMHVKAHDVRAISSSWALFNNASLEEVLSAGFWRTENSFISHYLQSLATQAQSLYSLGPLVSAQRVVFPPASSGSGDSALSHGNSLTAPHSQPGPNIGDHVLPQKVVCVLREECSIPFTVTSSAQQPSVRHGPIESGLSSKGTTIIQDPKNPGTFLCFVIVVGTTPGVHKTCVQTGDTRELTSDEFCFEVEIKSPDSYQHQVETSQPYFITPTIPHDSVTQCVPGKSCHALLFMSGGFYPECPFVKQTEGPSDDLHIFTSADNTKLIGNCTTDVTFTPPPGSTGKYRFCFNIFLPNIPGETRCFYVIYMEYTPVPIRHEHFPLGCTDYEDINFSCRNWNNSIGICRTTYGPVHTIARHRCPRFCSLCQSSIAGTCGNILGNDCLTINITNICRNTFGQKYCVKHCNQCTESVGLLPDLGSLFGRK